MKNDNEQGSILRIGKVTEYDASKHMARVNFSDMGIISHWLPVTAVNTLNTKAAHFLDAGEHVVCLMNGTGTESGCILGAIYDAKNLPHDTDKDTQSILFDDGTLINYSRKEHRLIMNVQGDIEITASGSIKLNAGRIDLN